MKRVSSQIDIKAPPEKVWKVLTDFSSWKDWNPVFIEAAGRAEAGTELVIKMGDQCGKSGMSYKPVVLEAAPSRRLVWRAKMMAYFLFTNDRIVELEPTPEGTRVVQREEFTGLLVPIFCRNMEKMVEPMLTSMNEALKKKVEAGG